MNFIGDSHSSIFAPNHTLVIGDNLVKVLAWYDNEWPTVKEFRFRNFVLRKLITVGSYAFTLNEVRGKRVYFGWIFNVPFRWKSK